MRQKTELRRDPIKEESRKYRRAVFDFDYWANHRSSNRYWRHIAGVFASHIVRSLAAPVLGVSSVAVLVVLYHVAYDMGHVPSWAPTLNLTSSEPLFLTASALSLLLVFRTNVSYQRFDEARKMWGLLLNRSRDIVRQATTFFPEDDVVGKAEFGRWTVAFSRALMCHVREDNKLRTECASLLTPDEIDWLMQSDHRVLATLQMMTQQIEWTDMDNWKKLQMQANITTFEDILGGCERLLRTPIPLSYTRHTSRFMLIWLMLVPVYLYSSLSWGVIPCTAIISYLILGIDEIGVDIEEPFGILPLEVISARAELDCKALVSNHLLWRRNLLEFTHESKDTNAQTYDLHRVRSDYGDLLGRDLQREYQRSRIEASQAFMDGTFAPRSMNGHSAARSGADASAAAPPSNGSAPVKDGDSGAPMDSSLGVNMAWLGIASALEKRERSPAAGAHVAPLASGASRFNGSTDAGVYFPGPDWPRPRVQHHRLSAPVVPADISLCSLSQYVAKQARAHRQELAEVMSAMSSAFKDVRRTLLNNDRGTSGLTKEAVTAVFQTHLQACPYVHTILASGAAAPYTSASPFGRYLFVLDALCSEEPHAACGAVPPSSTFTIYDHRDGLPPSGRRIIAAGCCEYSPDWSRAPDRVTFSCSRGTHSFKFAQGDSHYALKKQDLHLMAHGYVAMFDTSKYTSLAWPEGLTHYLHALSSGTGEAQRAYKVEDAGGLVANLATVLRESGVMGAPLPETNVMFNALPLAFLAQHAHGIATDGAANILDRPVLSEHELTAFYCGGLDDMMELHKYIHKRDASVTVRASEMVV